MMLKQDLCLKCYEGTLKEESFDGKNKQMMLLGFKLVWSMNGKCLCRLSEGLPNTVDVKSKPSLKCPYLLEQTLSEHA